jgi:hypothetical protein
MFRFCKTNIYSLFNVYIVCISKLPIVLISRSNIGKAFIESVQFGKLRIRTPNSHFTTLFRITVLVLYVSFLQYKYLYILCSMLILWHQFCYLQIGSTKHGTWLSELVHIYLYSTFRSNLCAVGVEGITTQSHSRRTESHYGRRWCSEPSMKSGIGRLFRPTSIMTTAPWIICCCWAPGKNQRTDSVRDGVEAINHTRRDGDTIESDW